MSAEKDYDLIELEKKSPRDLMVICVVKLNAIEGKILPSIDERLGDINGTVKDHGNRLTAIETTCHEARTTVFKRLDNRSIGDSDRPPKKYVAIGVTFIVIIGSLGYAVGRIMAWW